jgi:hypothetical protein
MLIYSLSIKCIY